MKYGIANEITNAWKHSNWENTKNTSTVMETIFHKSIYFDDVMCMALVFQTMIAGKLNSIQ